MQMTYGATSETSAVSVRTLLLRPSLTGRF